MKNLVSIVLLCTFAGSLSFAKGGSSGFEQNRSKEEGVGAITDQGAVPAPPLDQNPVPNYTEQIAPVEAATPDRSRIGIAVSGVYPYIANFGVDWFSVQKNFSFSIEGGSFGTTGTRKTVAQDLMVTGRWHFFQDAWFVGLGVGQHTMTVEQTGSIYAAGTNNATTIRVETTALAMTPHAGWLKKWNNGFNLGFSLGFIVPFNSTVNETVTHANIFNAGAVTGTIDFQNLENDTKTQSKNLGNTIIPYAEIVRVGWAF